MFVHGEIFAAPVHRSSEPPHLLLNRTAILFFPFPDALNKLFAAKFAPLLAFTRKLPLDHDLRSDASMVRPRNPKGQITAHASPTDENIHLRLFHHVAHVQTSSDVRRRQEQTEHRTSVSRRWGWHGEEILLHPVFSPARFDGAWLVRFRQVARHEKTVSTQKSAFSPIRLARILRLCLTEC